MIIWYEIQVIINPFIWEILLTLIENNLGPVFELGEDEYKLPPYVDALIFKDQIFEDDPEMERRTRKKRSFEQLSTQAPDGTGDESDDENEPILGGGGGSNNGSGLPLPDLNTSRLNESLTETDLSDNPFLRPVRLPRTPKKQRDWNDIYNVPR